MSDKNEKKLYEKIKEDVKDEIINIKREINIDEQRWLIKNGFCPDIKCNPELGKAEKKTVQKYDIAENSGIYKCYNCGKKWKFEKGLPKEII